MEMLIHRLPFRNPPPSTIESSGTFVRRRSPLNRAKELGYLTVTPELKLEVSGPLKQDWENGREYYVLHGRALWLPMAVGERPRAEYLAWYREERWLE